MAPSGAILNALSDEYPVTYTFPTIIEDGPDVEQGALMCDRTVGVRR